jgi:hypothetical protein
LTPYIWSYGELLNKPKHNKNDDDDLFRVSQHVVKVCSDVSEELTATIFRVTVV